MSRVDLRDSSPSDEVVGDLYHVVLILCLDHFLLEVRFGSKRLTDPSAKGFVVCLTCIANIVKDSFFEPATPFDEQTDHVVRTLDLSSVGAPAAVRVVHPSIALLLRDGPSQLVVLFK